MKPKALFGYLDFETVWFLDTSTGVNHPQLIANPEIGTHTHTYSAEVTAPTCTEQGYTTYTCSCGDSYRGAYVDALGHQLVTLAAVEATCAATGKTEGSYCSVCHTVLQAQEELAKVGHTIVTFQLPIRINC
jgi:hypothetical protein